MPSRSAATGQGAFRRGALLAVALVAALLLAACAGTRPTLVDESGSPVPDQRRSSGGGGGGAQAEASVGSGSIPSEHGGPGEVPPVLITPTGVLVTTTKRTATGYQVVTPCGNSAELTYGLPIIHADVVLDPGHGGDEKGALGPKGETEAEVNLDVARRTASLLEAQGVSVALTRSADYRVPVKQRAAIADALTPQAFVSIHHNSPTGPVSDKPGTEVYVQSASPQAKRLGGLIYQQVTQALAPFKVSWSRRPDAGVLSVLNDKGDNAYGIIRYPATPTALAELSYISNPAEAQLQRTPEYRQAVAKAVADAIVRYLVSTDPGAGFVAKARTYNPQGETGNPDGCVDPALQ